MNVVLHVILVLASFNVLASPKTLKDLVCEQTAGVALDYSELVPVQELFKTQPRELSDLLIAIAADPASCRTLERAFEPLAFVVPESLIENYMALKIPLARFALGLPEEQVERRVNIFGAFYTGVAIISNRFSDWTLLGPYFSTDFLYQWDAQINADQRDPEAREKLSRALMRASAYSGNSASRIWIRNFNWWVDDQDYFSEMWNLSLLVLNEGIEKVLLRQQAY